MGEVALRYRTLLATIVVGMVFAACGSSEPDSTAVAAGDITTTAVPATGPSEGNTAATESTERDGDDGTAGSESSSGTVVINGETKEFQDFSLAICDTDYLGTGVFNVNLINSDGSRETMTLALYPDGDPGQLSTLALLSTEASWVASATVVEGSSVDSFRVDGNRAEGTATLIADSGEGPVSATFEVTCAG